MHTPLQALIWELWHVSRWELAGRVCGQCLFLLVTLSVLTPGAAMLQLFSGLAVAMLASTSIFSVTWMSSLDNTQAGFCFHLGFTRPVSTTQLVVVPMVYIMGTSALCFLIPAGLMQLLFDVPIPALGPAAIIACVVACFVAVTWSPTSVAAKILGMAMVVAALIVGLIWLGLRHSGNEPFLLAMGQPSFFAFSWLEYCGFAIVAGAAIAATVIAVDCQRHGDRLRFFGSRRASGESAVRLWAADRPFASPSMAQFWYEMRRSGRKVLLIGLSTPILAFLVISGLQVFQGESAGGGTTAWLFLLAVCPPIYQLLGAEWTLGLQRKQGAVGLSTFDAKQSMRNDHLVAIKIATIAGTSLISWIAMASAAGVHALLWDRLGEWARIAAGIGTVAQDVPLHWWAGAVMALILLYLSSSAMLIAVGLWLPVYPRVFSAGLFIVLGHATLAIWDAENQRILGPLWAAYGWLLAAGMIGVCIISVSHCLRSGSMSKTYFLCAFCLWAVFAGMNLFLYAQIDASALQPPLWTRAFAVGLLTCPLSATALAPWALAAHRHQ